MKPNLNLTLTDPLAEQSVTIVLQLAPGESLNQRPVLMSLGIPNENELPVQAQGVFTDLERLIRTTWTSFGLQMKANAAATATPVLHSETDDALEDAEGDAICTTGNQRNESYFRFFHLAHSRFHSHGWASLVEVDDEFHYMK